MRTGQPYGSLTDYHRKQQLLDATVMLSTASGISILGNGHAVVHGAGCERASPMDTDGLSTEHSNYWMQPVMLSIALDITDLGNGPRCSRCGCEQRLAALWITDGLETETQHYWMQTVMLSIALGHSLLWQDKACSRCGYERASLWITDGLQRNAAITGCKR